MKRYIRPQAGLFACAVLFSLLAGGLAILVQFTKGQLLDQALAGLDGGTIRFIIQLLGLIAFEIICYHLFDRCRGAILCVPRHSCGRISSPPSCANPRPR